MEGSRAVYEDLDCLLHVSRMLGNCIVQLTMALGRKHQTACRAASEMALTDVFGASLDLYPS